MRLLRLDPSDGDPSLHLHPLLCVVPALTPAQRRQLLCVVRQLASGQANELAGLVQHQGLLVELANLGTQLLDCPPMKVDPVFEASTDPGADALGFDEVIEGINQVMEDRAKGFGAAVPLVVSGRFSGLDQFEIPLLMAALEDIALSNQVLMITGCPSVLDWVDRVGPARASIGVFLHR